MSTMGGQAALTAEELFQRKRMRPLTAKQVYEASWRVPGLDDMLHPPPRPVVTAVEAKRRFKLATQGDHSHLLVLVLSSFLLLLLPCHGWNVPFDFSLQSHTSL